MTDNSDNSDNFCVICYQEEFNNYDNSNNEFYIDNGLIEFKHCLNIKVHPECLCNWFITSNDTCPVCRKELNISHYIVNDINTFIVDSKNNNYDNLDITYPIKNIKLENNKNNEDENIPQLNLQILNDISNINIGNIRSYIEAVQLLNRINNGNGNNANRIVRVHFVNKLKFSLKSFIIAIAVYCSGLLLNQLYNSALSIISDIF